MPDFRITRGKCCPLFVFEVGQSIDLEACERRIQTNTARQTLRHRGRASRFFEYRPAPLRVAQEAAPIEIGPFRTGPTVDLVLYDFGAASLGYTIPIEGPLDLLLELSIALRNYPPLFADARRRVEEAIRSLGNAVFRSHVAAVAEDYLIFQIEETSQPEDAAAFCANHAGTIARILRGEQALLAPEEIRDATEARISFGLNDVTMVDWDAALVLDPDPEDVRAVLEVANVQLLEMRFLDGQLDAALERSYHLLARQGGWRTIAPGFMAEDLRQVAELQLESAVLLERVSNALKFFGEEYLTRIYRLVSHRFHLPELDGSITRKLQTIESLYQKMADRAAGRRMEALEWVVIILIALEIALSLAH